MAALPPPPCRLLALPGELRNRIYRFALLEDEPVTMNHTGFDRPGLMQTCKEVRADTVNIYYEENTFECQIQNFSSNPLLKWQQSLRSVASGLGTTRKIAFTQLRCNAYYVLRSGLSWPNHLEHLRRFHAGVLNEEVLHPSDIPQHLHVTSNVAHLLIGNMFCVAKLLKNEPWHVARKAMLDLRAVMSATGWTFSDR